LPIGCSRRAPPFRPWISVRRLGSTSGRSPGSFPGRRLRGPAVRAAQPLFLRRGGASCPRRRQSSPHPVSSGSAVSCRLVDLHVEPALSTSCDDCRQKACLRSFPNRGSLSGRTAALGTPSSRPTLSAIGKTPFVPVAAHRRNSSKFGRCGRRASRQLPFSLTNPPRMPRLECCLTQCIRPSTAFDRSRLMPSVPETISRRRNCAG
jgi:hypothetical protein